MNFDMTADRALFQEGVGEQAGFLPLYQGKLIWQYDSAFGNFTYHVKEQDLQQRLKSAETKRLISRLFDQCGPWVIERG